MALSKDLGFGPDEQLVRDQARRLLRESVPVDKLRALVARDHHDAYETKVQPAYWDEALWKQMVELGWTALGVPESAGGLGMKAIVSVTLSEELGRVAVPSPLSATMLATAVLKAAGADAWLEKIAGGEAATLAITPESGSWEPGDTDVEARAARRRRHPARQGGVRTGRAQGAPARGRGEGEGRRRAVRRAGRRAGRDRDARPHRRSDA